METFNVCQFFDDGTHEYEVRYVDVQEAVKVFHQLINSLGAKLGSVESVIITDSGDFTNMEWQYGKGITYPPELTPQGVSDSSKSNHDTALKAGVLTISKEEMKTYHEVH